jgi:hypothetical protein
MNRRVLVGGLLVLLASTAVVAANALRGPRQDGPVRTNSRVNIKFPLAYDQIFVWGMALPGNPTQTDALITSIEPVGTRGLEIVGVVVDFPVLRPDGICLMYGDQTAPSFPPPGVATRAVNGTVLVTDDRERGTCGSHPEVLVGVRRLPDSSAGRIDALRVVYVHEGTTYELVMPYSFDVCRPDPNSTSCAQGEP